MTYKYDHTRSSMSQQSLHAVKCNSQAWVSNNGLTHCQVCIQGPDCMKQHI